MRFIMKLGQRRFRQFNVHGAQAGIGCLHLAILCPSANQLLLDRGTRQKPFES